MNARYGHFLSVIFFTVPQMLPPIHYLLARKQTVKAGLRLFKLRSNMKYLSRLGALTSGMSLALVFLLGVTVSGHAAPAPKSTPPPSSFVSGAQSKPPVEPGRQDAKQLESLGATNLVKTDALGKPQAGAVTTLAGTVANVDFLAPLNYCSSNLVYAPVKNTTAATKYVQVRVYNQGGYRDIYTSVAANSTAYPAFYHTVGAYTAYLYVWNGSSYQSDEYRTGTNNCQVSVTRTYNAGGWVQLKIQNTGTAYAVQQSSELAPYPASGTYTGTHYDYPVAGGAAIYRWFSVGTSPYGIVSNTLGSFNAPYLFSGDL